MSGHGCLFRVTVILTIDLLIPKSIWIIFGLWSTKAPIIGPLSSIGFQFWADKDFMFKVTVNLTLELLTPKSKGVIYGSWPFMIQRKVNLGEICLKLMNGQIFANAGRKDGQTDRQTYRQTTCAITFYDRKSVREYKINALVVHLYTVY